MTPKPQSANPFRMTNTLSDPAENLSLLLRCPSVTPAEGGVLISIVALVGGQLLVERVDVTHDAAHIRLRTEGLASLVGELRSSRSPAADQPRSAENPVKARTGTAARKRAA